MKRKRYILFLASFLFLLSLPFLALAESNLPPFEFQSGFQCEKLSNQQGFALLRVVITCIYEFGIGLVIVLSIVVIMIGGVLWLLAGGSPDRVNNAKSYISSALIGLVIALLSYMILYAVNPRLVTIPEPDPNIDEQILQACQDNCTFGGFLTENNTCQCYRTIDEYVCARRHEECPGKVIETSDGQCFCGDGEGIQVFFDSDD